MPFQTRVNLVQAPAVEGDFASANPRATTLAGPGALVAGPNGVYVGRFAWIDPDMVTTNSFGDANNAPDGFVHRDQQALIENYLQEFSMLIPEGFSVTLHNAGDFWVRNAGPAALTKGAIVYAGFADGKAYSSAPAGASATGSLGSTNTAALGSTSTGTAVAGNPTQIALTAVTGVVTPGDAIAGVGVPAGIVVESQVSGTTGGAGTYQLSGATTAAAATITTYGNTLVVSASTGLISIGDTTAGITGVPAGTTIASQVSGTAGGAGTYTLSAPGVAYFASAAGVTTFGNVLKVSAVSSGTLAPGVPIATGTNLPATAIASQISGTTGGAGNYLLAAPGTQYVASEAFTTAGGIASGWTAMPTSVGDGAVGALVAITTYNQ